MLGTRKRRHYRAQGREAVLDVPRLFLDGLLVLCSLSLRVDGADKDLGLKKCYFFVLA